MRSYVIFFFKQKTAYEMRISDWSSDVCSSDLRFDDFLKPGVEIAVTPHQLLVRPVIDGARDQIDRLGEAGPVVAIADHRLDLARGDHPIALENRGPLYDIAAFADVARHTVAFQTLPGGGREPGPGAGRG